jgi:hypothetical protein
MAICAEKMVQRGPHGDDSGRLGEQRIYRGLIEKILERPGK